MKKQLHVALILLATNSQVSMGAETRSTDAVQRRYVINNYSYQIYQSNPYSTKSLEWSS